MQPRLKSSLSDAEIVLFDFVLVGINVYVLQYLQRKYSMHILYANGPFMHLLQPVLIKSYFIKLLKHAAFLTWHSGRGGRVYS